MPIPEAVKSKCKNTTIGPLKRNGETVLDDKTKAEVFNECFAAVFVPDDGLDLEPEAVFKGDESEMLCDIEITAEMVYKIDRKIDLFHV